MDVLIGQRTTYTKKESVRSNWILVDANEQILGRMASQVVNRLLGKHRIDYQPGVLTGDNVVIINASKVKVTGNKMEQKEYIWHTGFFGGLKRRLMKKQAETFPEKIILLAIKGMLPKNKFGRKVLTRVKVFPGAEHNLAAQQPVPFKLI